MYMYTISKIPLVCITYWEHYIMSYPKHDGYLLCIFAWQKETNDQIERVKKQMEKVPKSTTIIFLSNSKKELNNLLNCGYKAILCNQNALVDYDRFKILSNIKNKYNAIYIARITPFKRHYLAQELDNLLLIGNYSDEEKEYALNTINSLSKAKYIHKVSHFIIQRYINSASVGLCLSAKEGAMYVSIEYLLCGIPIVTTKSIGGRDEMYPSSGVYYADDNPTSVKNAVAKALGEYQNRQLIRENTIKHMNQHRNNLKELLSEICNRNMFENWDTYYKHKFCLMVSKWERFYQFFNRR